MATSNPVRVWFGDYTYDRYGIGMRQLCLDEGGVDPALGLVKLSDVSKLRCVGCAHWP